MSIFGQDCLASSSKTTAKFISRSNLKLINKTQILTHIIDFKKFIRGVTFNKPIEINYHIKDLLLDVSVKVTKQQNLKQRPRKKRKLQLKSAK